MPAMFDLITLYREAIHKPDTSIVRPTDSPELAMDYFDTLIARNFGNLKKDSVKEFLGLNIEEEYDQNRVAMQSIPLYCPEYVYEYYHNKYPDIYRNPFLTKSSAEKGEQQELCARMPYLSVIEVFITPEVIARLNMDAVCNARSGDCFDNEERRALRIYNAFYRDLHRLMVGFLEDKKNTADENFIYCIYESASIGDFAVVIRSSRPETAFKVTTLLRERSCRLEYEKPEMKEKDDPESLVLYKTFTIFSLNEKVSDKAFLSGQVISGEKGCEQEEPEGATRSDIITADDEVVNKVSGNADDPCRYVLRGVLSNLYWNIYGDDKNPDKLRGTKSGSAPELRDVLNDAGLRRFFHRLHGRYDFTVTISERAFRAIHPVLVRYKLDRNNKLPMGEGRPNVQQLQQEYMLDDDETTICDTLIGYILKGYVSYINERYLFSLDTSEIKVTKYNEDICLKPVEGRLKFTIDYIEEEIKKLKKRIWESRRKLLDLNTSRGSLIYSMKILEKLANMCSAVNGISDARIYSLVICRQIGAVLNGADEYIDYINESKNLAVVKHLDQDMKAAIESINSFAQFILESTVQSFQAPIYNLESHVSVEKMLTGYSWMLQSIFGWFEGSNFFKDIKGGTQKYLTVMVPDGFDGTLSTKSILFKLSDRNNGSKEKLLTVYCPSFTDLTDFTGAFGTFFHEIAHYMRYESRIDRNKVILEYSSMLLFDQTVDIMVLDFQHHVAGIVDNDTIWTILLQCFSEAYSEAVYLKYFDPARSESMNLMLLIQKIKITYQRFIKRIRLLSTFEIALDAFLDNSSYMVDKGAQEVISCFKTIRNRFFYESDALRNPEEFVALLGKGNKLLTKYASEIEEKEKQGTRQRLVETSYLARCLEYIIEEMGENEEEVSNFVDDCAAIQLFYRLLDKKLRNNVSKGLDDQKSFRFFQFLFPDRTSMSEEERIQTLRRYVSVFIVSSETENLMMFEEFMALYREVSSDLYMAKSLELTPFGYLNFLVRNTPMEIQMGETYMERCCRVLYAMKGKEAGRDQAKWREMLKDIFKGLRGFLKKEAKKNRSVLIEASGSGERPEEIKAALVETGNRFDKFRKFISESEKGGIPEDKMTDICSSYLDKCLIPMWEDTGTKIRSLEEKYTDHSVAGGMRELNEAFRVIKHQRYLCQAFIQIDESFNENMAKVERFPFLADDFLNGNENLEKMSTDLNESPLMQYYCSNVQMEYNEPEKARKGTSDQVWEVEFIMDMHYGMIWNYAEEILKQCSETGV